MKASVSLPMESVPGSHVEPVESQFTQDELHTRLIHVEAEGTDIEGARHVIEIVEDQTLVLGGVRVALTDPKTFIFNIQHLRQGEALTAVGIKNAGFRGARTTFTRNIRELCQVLNHDPEHPVVERRGDRASSTYTLLPDVKIVDKRKEMTAGQKREQFLRDRIVFDEDGVVEFLGPKARREVTCLMLQEFAHSPYIESPNTHLLKMIDDTVTLLPRTLKKALIPLKTAAIADVEDESPLLEQKEEALRVFVGRSDNLYTIPELQAISRGIHAIFDLFRINVDLPLRTANKFAGYALPYEDLYQECALELFKGILEQPFDSTGKFFFSYIASKRMKEVVLKRVRMQSDLVNYPRDLTTDLYAVHRCIRDFEEKYGEIPSRRHISEETKVPLDQVVEILRIRSCVLTDFAPPEGEEGVVDRALVVEDFADDALDHLSHRMALDALFKGEALTDNEKIILSLDYGIFFPSLQGAKFHYKNREVFIYPDTEAELLAMTRGKTSSKIATSVLKIPVGTGASVQERALSKSRNFLMADAGKGVSISTAESEREDLENRRRELVIWALTVSPDKAMGTKELRRHVSETAYTSEAEVYELFDTMPEFQKACGFEPNRIRANRGMTPEEVVALALDIKSGGPLTAPEIKRLSKEGLFVSMTVVLRLFDRSIVNFYAACGFPAVKQIKSNFHRKR